MGSTTLREAAPRLRSTQPTLVLRSHFIDKNSDSYIATQNSSIGHDSVLKVGILGDSSQNFVTVNPQEVSSSQIRLRERNIKDLFGISEVSIGQIGTDKPSLQYLGSTKIASTQISASELGFLQVSSTEISPTQVGMIEISSPQTATIQISSTQVSHVKTGVSQINVSQIGSAQIDPMHPENNILQVTISENSPTQVNSFEIPITKLREATTQDYFDPGKVSFPTSISLEQLFKSYYHFLPHISNNTYKDNPLNLWSTLFYRTFNITLQIADLPTGQLAGLRQKTIL